MFFNDWLARREIYTPEREAVTDTIEGRRITYKDLNRRASALASWLSGEKGVGRGERVACLSGNRLEYLALFFACGKIGAVLVPLNYRLREHGLRQAFADSMPC